MSAVIIGGNERMERKYRDICARYNCRAKVFPLKTSCLADRLGCPDLIFLCMDTVSHTMVKNAMREARKKGLRVVRLQTASVTALEKELAKYAAGL